MAAKDGLKTGDRTDVGFFLPLPKGLASAFPSLAPKDLSPAHVTFLYVGQVPASREQEFLNISKRVFSKAPPQVRAVLDGLDYFVNAADFSRVAVNRVRFEHDLAALRWNLRQALLDAGFKVGDSYPLIYRPHVTLAYLQGMDAPFKAPVPSGSWTISGVEVWGLPSAANISLGSLQPQRKRAMTHERSVALMKFLSEVARRLGVGKNVYVVGGAVRNWVIKEPIKDIDVVIDPVALNRPDASDWFAKAVASAIPVKTSLVTNNYGVAILSISGDWMLDGESLKGEVIEIANARTESYGGEGGKGYKPHLVAPASIEEDTFRREFTFNTLLWRLHDLADGPDKAEILDLTGCGLKDLKDGWMKCPSDPDKTFSDDPSRMVRAVKFLLKYGFKIAPDVKAAIIRNKEKLRNVPPSHLSDMLLNVFFKSGVGKAALLEMDKLGLLDIIRDVARTDIGFQRTLASWAESKASIEFLFDLMDLGMPTGRRLRFLEPDQKAQLRALTVQMDAAEAEAFVQILEQPGKVLDFPRLMEEFSLRGQEVQRLTSVARVLALGNPQITQNAPRWEEAVRHQLVRAHLESPKPLRASSPLVRQGGFAHFKNTCPKCGGINQCRCLGPRVETANLCPECSTHMVRELPQSKTARLKKAMDQDEPFEVLDYVRGYKQISGVRRVPIARNTDPKTGVERIIIGNDEIDRLGLRLPGKDYLSDALMERLFQGEVVIEEKVDGHPVVILYGGYTFFCESLRIQHTVSYDNVPYSEAGWPDMTVVYEIMDGEKSPPYKYGDGTGKWLSRSEKESLCSLVGAPLVPLVFRGKVTPETLPKLADRLSSFGSGSAEGVVVKNLKTGVFGKFINLEFQKAISEEALWGDGVHPELRGVKNLRTRMAHRYLDRLKRSI